MKHQWLTIIWIAGILQGCSWAQAGRAGSNNPPQSALSQLPCVLKSSEPDNSDQRYGQPVKITAKRTFRVQAGEHHESRNNIVAIYIGLPTPDVAQQNITIEEISSQRAEPQHIIFSSHRDTLLVEYFNVPPGFQDEISITFSMDIYQQRNRLSLSKVLPYNKESQIYKKYCKSENENEDPYLQRHLKSLGYRQKSSALTNAQQIYLYLGKRLRYGNYGSEEPLPEDLLKGGKTNCGGYAMFFIDLCKEAGIPARRCAGFWLQSDPQNPAATTIAPHNWAEFYLEGIGWVPIDPIAGDKLDKRRLFYFGNLDNGHLCISKSGTHHPLPIWYKNSAAETLRFTDDLDYFKPDLYPFTIQAVYKLQYRWDKPIHITVLDIYGQENLQILSRKGEFRSPDKD